MSKNTNTNIKKGWFIAAGLAAATAVGALVKGIKKNQATEEDLVEADEFEDEVDSDEE